MALDKVYQLALVLVTIGILLGMGVLLVDKFGDAVKEPATVTDETIVIAAGTGTTANNDVLSVLNLSNATVAYATICNDAGGCDVNWTKSGKITVNSTKWIAGSYKISYTYDADTAATVALGGVNTELSGIATTWLPIIIIVFIAGLLITIIAASFFVGKGRT